jgi:SAM-dependent methyltransferase
MEAREYDRWYETPRGRWIGQRELALLVDALEPQPGESLLDVGCGTGFFTRSLEGAFGPRVLGVDVNADWVEYARRRETGGARYEVADACALPYADGSFDVVVSIAALCFVAEEAAAVREIVRVARRRFAIGLLNRHSLLWLAKGRGGGRGGYRGAHWHTAGEARALFGGLPVRGLRVRTAIQIPDGGILARAVERVWPASIASGAFLLAVGDVAADAPQQSASTAPRASRKEAP